MFGKFKIKKCPKETKKLADDELRLWCVEKSAMVSNTCSMDVVTMQAQQLFDYIRSGKY